MFVLYTNSVSAHQLPLARELVKRFGAENFRYVYTGENLQHGNQEVAASEPWIIRLAADESSSSSSGSSDSSSDSSSSSSVIQSSKLPNSHLSSVVLTKEETSKLLSSCSTLLVGGLYPIDLMEARLAAGKKTLYMSERWFKPIGLGLRCRLPGWVRMLYPGYFRRARRFAKMLRNPNYWYLPIGPWAEKDMRLVQRLTFSGPAANPFIEWGYFVATGSDESLNVSKFESLKVQGESSSDSSSSSSSSSASTIHSSSVVLTKEETSKHSNPLRVLWVGRMLDWKRVDTIVRAVARANDVVQANSSSSSSSNVKHQTSNIKLTLVGDGPEKPRLQKLVSKLQTSNVKRQTSNVKPSNFQTLEPSNLISFLPPVPIAEVRTLMRQHDIYVLASNAQEGWGAALSEAMTEGMECFGTYEAGASAALLPPDHLFHAGDYKALAKLLVKSLSGVKRAALTYEYTPEGAARRVESLMFEGLKV